MNYELAKQLWDNGFWEDRVYDETKLVRFEINRYFDSHSKNYEELPVPTLSELIEACGDELHCLEQWIEGDEKGWFAYHMGIKDKGEGKTPEIAVANLWLELNKK